MQVLNRRKNRKKGERVRVWGGRALAFAAEQGRFGLGAACCVVPGPLSHSLCARLPSMLLLHR